LQSAYLDAFEKERITLVGCSSPPDLGGDDAGIGPEHVPPAAAIPNSRCSGG